MLAAACNRGRWVLGRHCAQAQLLHSQLDRQGTMFYKSVWRKFLSLERRAFLLAEIEQIERKGRHVPPMLRRLAKRSPSAAEDWINFLRVIDPAETVQLIDVGANRGEWCQAFLATFPNTSVIAIEPAANTSRSRWMRPTWTGTWSRRQRGLRTRHGSPSSWPC